MCGPLKTPSTACTQEVPVEAREEIEKAILKW